MRGFEELLSVMRDARLEGNEPALLLLGRELAERFGAASAGMDRFGAWLSLAVGDTSFRMRFIAQGRFVMGTPGSTRPDEQPREVHLTRGYWLASVPVTQHLWRVVTAESPSTFAGDRRPVESVSWDESVAFCQRLSQRLSVLRVRLPTEAEWEYAARAGRQGDIRGSEASDDIAWYADNSGIDPMEIDDPLFAAHPVPVGLGTREVGQKEPNAWGLYDTLGNVYEWCADAIEYGAPCSTEPQRDPIGLVGPERAQRGGGWNIEARYARVGFRNGTLPEERRDNLGLRLAADGPG